jgi:hypothetical protein
MCVYCRPCSQTPFWHGVFIAYPKPSVTRVSASSTRSGVQNRRAPSTPCRPQGPPTSLLAARATGSTWDGGSIRSASPTG